MPKCNAQVTIDKYIIVSTDDSRAYNSTLHLHIKEWDEFVSVGTWRSEDREKSEQMAHNYAKKVGLE